MTTTETQTVPRYIADRVMDILIATTIDVVGAESQMKATNILRGQCDVAAALFDASPQHLQRWLIETLADYHQLRPALKHSKIEMVRRDLARRWRLE